MNINYRLTLEEEKRNNKIIGDLFVLNTDIKFIGNNNIIYVNGSVSLVNSNIYFRGNNSLIYICNTDDKLTLDIKMYNNSVLYFGEDMWINRGIKIVISEQNNVFFGRDCLVSYDICLRTADPHLIYDTGTYKRINNGKSIYVGDHVWLGQHVFVLKNATIGSGSIFGAFSVVTGKKYSSNVSYAGNPSRKIRDNVFFLKENSHYFADKEIEEFSLYPHDDYIYEKDDKTLSFEKIEEDLNRFSVKEKIEYLTDITNNKSKNRFFIE